MSTQLVKQAIFYPIGRFGSKIRCGCDLQAFVNLRPSCPNCRARDLTFSENVHLTPHIVRYQDSRVICHVWQVTFFFFFFFLQSGWASRWRVCYQRCLPCLVFVIQLHERGCGVYYSQDWPKACVITIPILFRNNLFSKHFLWHKTLVKISNFYMVGAFSLKSPNENSLKNIFKCFTTLKVLVLFLDFF